MIASKTPAIRVLALLVAIATAICVFALVGTIFRSGRAAHLAVEWVGIVLIVICVLGRAWARLYSANGKDVAFASDGFYSVSRHPLDMFLIIGAVGMGMQTGSLIVGLICGAIAWIALRAIVTQEEKWLVDAHGASYRDYISRVPLLLPKWPLWKAAPISSVPQSSVVWMFGDGLLFLLAVPIAEYLEQAHIVPVLLKLP